MATGSNSLLSFQVREKTGLFSAELNLLILEDLFPGTSCADGLTWDSAAVEAWQRRVETDPDFAEAISFVIGCRLDGWADPRPCGAYDYHHPDFDQ